MAILLTVLLALLTLSDSYGQLFTEQPVPSINFQPSTNIVNQLSCSANVQNNDDVIGWVVGTTRISNRGNIDSDAVTAALGASAFSKLSAPYELDGSNVNLELDFFNADTDIVGDYKCQLCTNDGNDGCGTILEESTVAEVRAQYQPSEEPTCLPPSSTSSRVILGESIPLSCSSDPGVPEVQLEWLYSSNMQVIPGQLQPIQSGGILYNNFTFTPALSDSGLGPICRMTTDTGSQLQCTASPLTLVSTPRVTVRGPTSTASGASATFTCTAESPTNTLIQSYTWDVDVDASRIEVAANGQSIIISDITDADHQKSVKCEVIDAADMVGSGAYPILVMGEVVPSNLPTFPTLPPAISTEPTDMTTEPTPAGGLPVVVIVVIVVIMIILLCIILGTVWFCCNRNKMAGKKLEMYPPTVEKNNLSPVSTSPLTSEKTFAYPNNDSHNPDVIPKGLNERSVDGSTQQYWRESAAPPAASPIIKTMNLPFSSKSSLHNQYSYNPEYDDKVDPADLDFKEPFDKDYSDSGIGYRDGDNGYYPDEKYGKQFGSDGGYDDHNYGDREYGDGHPDPYQQDFGDAGNYGTVYDDDFRQPLGQYGGQYDDYPDRMPDGSEGYNPAPDEYPAPSRDVYGGSADYGRPVDYDAPMNYDEQTDGYVFDGQPAEYEERPLDYDYQPTNYPSVPESYGSDNQYYPDAPYDDQYNQPVSDPYYANRVPDGGASEQDDYNYSYPPEGEPYNDGYGNYNSNYGDADYAQTYPAQDSNAPYEDPRLLSIHDSQGEPYFDPDSEMATSGNPSYV